MSLEEPLSQQDLEQRNLRQEMFLEGFRVLELLAMLASRRGFLGIATVAPALYSKCRELMQTMAGQPIAIDHRRTLQAGTHP